MQGVQPVAGDHPRGTGAATPVPHHGGSSSYRDVLRVGHVGGVRRLLAERGRVLVDVYKSGDREPPDREMCRRLEAALARPRDEIWMAAARARTREAEWELWRSKMLAVGVPDLSATESNIVQWLREIDWVRESEGRQGEPEPAAVSPAVQACDYFPERPNRVATGLSELLLVLAADRNTQEGARGDAVEQFADALAHMSDLSPYSRARVIEAMHASVMAAIGNRFRKDR